MVDISLSFINELWFLFVFCWYDVGLPSLLNLHSKLKFPKHVIFSLIVLIFFIFVVPFFIAENVQEHIPVWISFHIIQPWV